MTQIINLLVFLKEMLFPSDKLERRKEHSSFRRFLVMAALVSSVGLNYFTVQGIYQATTKIIRLKKELQELRQIKGDVLELQRTNEVLRLALQSLAPETLALILDSQNPKPGLPLPMDKQPTLPPPSTARQNDAKETPLQGKTPPVGN